MNSTLNPEVTGIRDVLIARADEQLAHTYEQIAQTDEEIARMTERLSKLEHDAPRRPAVLDRRPSRGRPLQRGLIGLLLAACVFVAAFVSQSSYGDAARLMIAQWAPQLISTSSLRPEKAGFGAQPSPSAVQLAGVESTPPQPTPAAQAAPQATTVPASPEVTQMLQTIVRDLANLEQRIDQLKTGQEQMASDNAKAVEQLKASQEQMARLVAKASEQVPQPKTSPPPRHPIATQAPKPAPTRPSPQARAQPQAPVQLQPEDQ